MDSLVNVRSFLGVAEAELARTRLAMDGISARLSNANMITWFWHYSNVTGGVKLLVKSTDLRRAALVLSSRSTPPQWRAPPWICPSCRADVDNTWSLCWSCGTSRNGEADPEFHTWYREFSTGSHYGKSIAEWIAIYFSLIYLFLFIIFKASLIVIIAWFITLILWGVLSRLCSLHEKVPLNPVDFAAEQDLASDVSYNPLRDEFNPADETAYNLWKAAFFSCFYLPLFFPIAIWHWFKTQQSAMSLSKIGRRHYFYSSLFLILAVIYFGWLVLFICCSIYGR